MSLAALCGPPRSMRHSPAEDRTAPMSCVVVVLPQLPVTPTKVILFRYGGAAKGGIDRR